ncbi:hypothetical protein C8R45DRAFT_201192 [Mycena sanguinolenta]|nr:hypothetical protein C8R45DRAFT_201192 [Mycena sanguinolenta]
MYGLRCVALLRCCPLYPPPCPSSPTLLPPLPLLLLPPRSCFDPPYMVLSVLCVWAWGARDGKVSQSGHIIALPRRLDLRLVGFPAYPFCSPFALLACSLLGDSLPWALELCEVAAQLQRFVDQSNPYSHTPRQWRRWWWTQFQPRAQLHIDYLPPSQPALAVAARPRRWTQPAAADARRRAFDCRMPRCAKSVNEDCISIWWVCMLPSSPRCCRSSSPNLGPPPARSPTT